MGVDQILVVHFLLYGPEIKDFFLFFPVPLIGYFSISSAVTTFPATDMIVSICLDILRKHDFLLMIVQ